MTPFGFADDGREVSAAKAEALLQNSSHTHPRAIPGDTIVLAVHPDAAGAVVNLEHTGPENAVRSGYAPSNGNFLANEMAGIAIDSLDAGARGTRRQDQGSNGEQ